MNAAAKPPSKEDLKALQKKIKNAENKLNKKKNETGKLQNSLRQTETALAKNTLETKQLQNAIYEQQQQLNTLEKDQQQLADKKKILAQQIAQQIAASYRLGREEKIKVLLNQQDPQKLSRHLSYADYFNKARIETIESFQQTIRALETIKPAIEKKSAALLQNKEALIEQQKQLKQHFAARKKTLNSINASIKTDQKKLQKLQQEQTLLADLLKAVEVTVKNIKLPSDATPFANNKGKLLWPSKGELKNRYGKKRPPSNLRWQGISFLSQAGKKINAIHHGRIIFADWFRGKGLLTIIDHGDGYMSLYAHQQTQLREAGDWISAGENIGTVGSSGGLDHAELYFEIRHNGKAINPKRWLTRKR